MMLRDIREAYPANGAGGFPKGSLLVYNDEGLQVWFRPEQWRSYTYRSDRTLEVALCDTRHPVTNASRP